MAERAQEGNDVRISAVTVRQPWLDRFPPVVQAFVLRSFLLATLRHHGIETYVPIGEKGWRR